MSWPTARLSSPPDRRWSNPSDTSNSKLTPTGEETAFRQTWVQRLGATLPLGQQSDHGLLAAEVGIWGSTLQGRLLRARSSTVVGCLDGVFRKASLYSVCTSL